ncbi:MAG: hypothetical protein ABL995_18905, partial [Bryobacteraceae bacterium]
FARIEFLVEQADGFEDRFSIGDGRTLRRYEFGFAGKDIRIGIVPQATGSCQRYGERWGQREIAS